MALMTQIEILNWQALYLATSICCALAVAMAAGAIGYQTWRARVAGDRFRQGGNVVPAPAMVEVAEALFHVDARNLGGGWIVRAFLAMEMSAWY